MSQTDARETPTSMTQMSFSNSEDRYNFIVAKLERVSQALYLLTNHLPVNEPFRIGIRQRAIDLIGELYEVQTRTSMHWNSLVRLVNQSFNELDSLLQIGLRAGLMSEMNHRVLDEQMQLIRQVASDSSLPKDTTLKDSFFDTNNRQKNLDNQSVDYEDIQKDNKTRVPNKFSDTSIDQSENQVIQKSNSRRRHGTNHSKRRRAILGLFRDKDEIDINDVQSVIEGCSQKTMQRELKSMVNDGLIEKKGKRRWSSYILDKGVDLDQELD